MSLKQIKDLEERYEMQANRLFNNRNWSLTMFDKTKDVKYLEICEDIDGKLEDIGYSNIKL